MGVYKLRFIQCLGFVLVALFFFSSVVGGCSAVYNNRVENINKDIELEDQRLQYELHKYDLEIITLKERIENENK